MNIQENVSLTNYSTMRLGGCARALSVIKNYDDLKQALEWANKHELKVVVIGEGSNVIWQDSGFPGLILINQIKGMEKIDEDETTATYKIGAGENWDDVVNELTKKDLSGIECLSLIPGTAGATPVQNVGAYGQDISQTLVSLDAYDTVNNHMMSIKNEDCDFGYRTSRFKTSDKGRFIITGITLKLSKTPINPPFYAGLQAYLDSNNITVFNPMTIRNAIIDIRSHKLPNWHIVATNGSFFENPIVSTDKYEELKQKLPDLVAWQHEGGYKLSAGWLLEKAGLKGFHDASTGMATSDKSALVLINENAKSTNDLVRFKKIITDKIKDMFDLELEQEPEIIP